MLHVPFKSQFTFEIVDRQDSDLDRMMTDKSKGFVRPVKDHKSSDVNEIMSESEFKFEIITKHKAEEELHNLRSFEMESIYDEVIEAVSNLKKREVLKVEIDTKRVQILRLTLDKKLGKNKYKIRSARVEDGKSIAFVIRLPHKRRVKQ